MQPLKRFTQCGSLTMLFTVFIVLFGVSSTALTTFGKSPQIPPPPVTQPPVKGRECNSHIDCSAIQHTSCVRDLEDNRLRCLCGDNRAPINGYCSDSKKALRHMCTDSDQCDIELICGNDNITTKLTGFNRNTNVIATSKICLCDEENGWKEDIEDNRCDGAVQIYTGFLLPFASVLFGLIFSVNNLH